MSWLASLLLRGARALVVAITMLPVLLVVILSAPAWVVWPWLGEERRESVHRMSINSPDGHVTFSIKQRP